MLDQLIPAYSSQKIVSGSGEISSLYFIPPSPAFLEGINITILPPDGVRIVEGDSLTIQANFTPPIPDGLDVKVLAADRHVAKIVELSIYGDTDFIEVSSASGCQFKNCSSSSEGDELSTKSIVLIDVKGKRLGRCPIKFYLINKTSDLQKAAKDSEDVVSLVDYDRDHRFETEKSSRLHLYHRHHNSGGSDQFWVRMRVGFEDNLGVHQEANSTSDWLFLPVSGHAFGE